MAEETTKTQATEAVKAEKIEKNAITKITATKEEQGVTYPIDKVNRELFREGKNLDGDVEAFEKEYFTATNEEKATLPIKELPAIFVSLNWSESADNQETDCHLNRALSPFAKEVYIAINSLWELGIRENVTAYMIYKAMGKKGKPKKADIEKIWTALNDLRQTVAFIKNDKETKQHKKAKEILIKDAPLLYFERFTENDMTDFSVNIPIQPFLIREAARRGQARRISQEVLNPPLKASDRVTELKFYLIEAILNSQNPKMSDKLRWDTVYKDLQITERLNRFRTRKDTEKMLSYYQDIGFIEGFTITPNEMVFQHQEKDEQDCGRVETKQISNAAV